VDIKGFHCHGTVNVLFQKVYLFIWTSLNPVFLSSFFSVLSCVVNHILIGLILKLRLIHGQLEHTVSVILALRLFDLRV